MRRKWYGLVLCIAGILFFLISLTVNEYASLIRCVGGALIGVVFAHLIRQTQDK